MTKMTHDDLVVARRPGQRLFLAGGAKTPVAFEGISPRTIFFRREEFERELKRLGVSKDSVQPVPASLEVVVG